MNDETQLGQLDVTLRLISTEIGNLNNMIRPVEIALEADLGKNGSTSNLRNELQGIDLLSQSVEALADFLQCIAQSVPEDQLVDLDAALSGVKLEAMKARLCAQHPAPQHDTPSGDEQIAPTAPNSAEPGASRPQIELF